MVKAVQAEDAVAEHFDALLKNRVAAEVGLLIGKPSVGSRDIVLAVVPHPDGEEVLSVSAGAAPASTAAAKSKKGAAGAKGSSSSSSGAAVSVSVRHEDVADHALQVSRMLPGGLSVLGLYLFAPDSGFSSATSTLCKALCSIAADLKSLSSGGAGQQQQAEQQQQQELLVLHVDSTTRKFTVKSCLASNGEHAATASLKPCELKFGPSLASLVCLRSRHTFDLTLPATSGSAQLQQLLQEAVSQESARVMAGIATVGGCVPASSTQPLAELLPASSSGVTGGANSITDPVQVDLLCSPSSGAGSTNSAAAAAYGSCRLHGTVEAIAYVHRRDAAVKALSELKQDITRSLTARLQLLENETASAAYEAQQQQQQQAGADGGKGAGAGAAPAHPLLAEVGVAKRTSRGLLRRVLMPWADLGGIQVCDYLMEGDTPEAAVEQGQQLLGLSALQASQVVAAEAPAQMQAVKGVAVSGGSGSGGPGGCGNAVMGAAAAGVAAAVAVALAYLNLGQ